MDATTATGDALDEARLVALAQAGDRDATDALLAAHTPMMMSVACAFAGSGADVDDLMQEARIAFLERIKTYEPGHGTELETWAYMPVRCAVRRASDRERRGARACAGDDEEAWLDRAPFVADEVAERLDADAAFAALSPLLAALDPLDVEILTLRRVEGLSQRETGERVGLSHTAVRKREQACLGHLRRAGIRFPESGLDDITGARTEGDEPTDLAPRGSAPTRPVEGQEETTIMESLNGATAETPTTPTTTDITITETPATETPGDTHVVTGGTPGASAETTTGVETTTTTTTPTAPPSDASAGPTGEASPPSEKPTETPKATRRAPVHAGEKLASLSTVEGWVAFLKERVNAAVEAARKDDPDFKAPISPDEIVTLVGEAFSVVLPEVTPKLAALASACTGAHDARIKRESDRRVEALRKKAAAAKAADPDKAARELAALRAKLAALEAALKK